MRILLLAALPIIVRVHYVAISQISRQMSRAAVIFLVAAVMEISFSIAGALMGGLVGLSVGWVLAVYVEGIVMIPAVYRAATRLETPSAVNEAGSG
jgi:hypothetical protein